MSDAVLTGLIAGPAVLFLDRMISWVRNRRQDDAVVGLTVDQRWQQLADRLDQRVEELEGRVDDLEEDLRMERQRAAGLTAEVDRYKRVAKSLLRYVLRLRDQLAETTGSASEMPRDVEEAITTIDLP